MANPNTQDNLEPPDKFRVKEDDVKLIQIGGEDTNAEKDFKLLNNTNIIGLNTLTTRRQLHPSLRKRSRQ